MTGHKQCVNMGINEAWLLDTEKHLRAVNNGDEDRVHLVIDIVSNLTLEHYYEHIFIDRDLYLRHVITVINMCNKMIVEYAPTYEYARVYLMCEHMRQKTSEVTN